MRTADQNRRARIAHEAAYQVLPRYACDDTDRLKGEFERSPDMAAVFYYVLAANGRGEKPNVEDIRQVRGHTGRFGSKSEYMVVEYPRFPADDLLSGFEGASPVAVSGHILAPYFSAIVDDREVGEPRYYVLGQSPDASTTTLRAVTQTMNTNLGPGCEPTLEALLKLIRGRMARRGE